MGDGPRDDREPAVRRLDGWGVITLRVPHDVPGRPAEGGMTTGTETVVGLTPDRWAAVVRELQKLGVTP